MAMGARALKKRIIEAMTKYETKLHVAIKDIHVNGAHVGCSGFIKNIDTQSCVYVNTDVGTYQRGQVMYRGAMHLKDCVGHTNHWTTPEALAEDAVVHSMLDMDHPKFRR